MCKNCVYFVGLIISTALFAERLNITFHAAEYEIKKLPEGEKIYMQGFNNLSIPGKPAIPVKVFLVALPPGAKVRNVYFTSNPIELPGKYNIKPSPMVIPLDNNQELTQYMRKVYEDNYSEVYGAAEDYPEDFGKYLGRGALRRYNFVKIAFYPFRWNPKSRKLLFTNKLDVTIEYQITKDYRKELLNDNLLDEVAEQFIINYEDAQKWYPRGAKVSPSYVIITTPGESAAVDTLVKWKTSLGYQVKVVTTTWIDSLYSGSDLAEKIRNFLIDKYPASEWAIKYVLIIGNSSDIPMRKCWPDSEWHTNYQYYNPVPTDYYYADLTGDWDADGDGYFGELGEDSMDFAPEVYVGRIPWSDTTTIKNICEKLVKFEQDTSSWKNNALLLGSILFYDDQYGLPDYEKVDGAFLMELVAEDIISDWTIKRLYEKEGVDPSEYACDYPLDVNNVVSEWSTGKYGIVNWAGHGWYDAAYRTIWAEDADNDGVPDDNELQWKYFISNTEVPSLDDEHPSIVFCASCLNAYPEASNIARELCKNGGAGIIAATRVSWGAMPWDGPEAGGIETMDYYFFYWLVKNNNRVGDALYNSKFYYANNFLWGWWDAGNLYDFCLYGEPALVYEGIVSHDCAVIEIISPKGLYALGDTINSTVVIENRGKEVLSYLHVFCKIKEASRDYLFERLVGNLAPGVKDTVKFAIFTLQNYGIDSIIVTAKPIQDDNFGNNELKSVFYVGYDISAENILGPSSPVLRGESVTPIATIKNVGPTEATNFYVRCEAQGYKDSVFISSLQPGEVDTVYFNDWIPTRAGSTIVKITTLCEHDYLTKNDVTTKVVWIPYNMYGPDAFGYWWIGSDTSAGPSYEWIEIDTIGTSVYLYDDDETPFLDLPDTMMFYGKKYAKIKIISNGWISFTEGLPTSYYSPSPIPSTQKPNCIIAPFWADLNPEDSPGGAIYYYCDTVNSRMIIEWKNINQYYGIGKYTFEVILNCKAGDIVFQYKSADERWDYNVWGFENHIGIENEDGTIGLTHSDHYLRDNYAIRFYYEPLVKSAWTGSSPQIDGIIDEEWENAFKIDISDILANGDTIADAAGAAYLYVMNDNNNLYIACEYLQDTIIDYFDDKFVLYIDENHDGNWADDSSEGYYTFLYKDREVTYYALPSGYSVTNPANIEFRVSMDGHMSYEISLPFGSSKPLVNAAPGDEVGILCYVVDGGRGIGGWWPKTVKNTDMENPTVYGRLILATPVGIKETPKLPTGFALHQNMPNPMHNTTTIFYELPKDCKISIKIYNIAGQLVKTLVDKHVRAGYHKVTWDGKDETGRKVSSGVYFYCLSTNNLVKTRKLVVIR